MLFYIPLLLISCFLHEILATEGIVDALYDGDEEQYLIDQEVLANYELDFTNTAFLATLLGQEHECLVNTNSISAVNVLFFSLQVLIFFSFTRLRDSMLYFLEIL